MQLATTPTAAPAQRFATAITTIKGAEIAPGTPITEQGLEGMLDSFTRASAEVEAGAAGLGAAPGTDALAQLGTARTSLTAATGTARKAIDEFWSAAAWGPAYDDPATVALTNVARTQGRAAIDALAGLAALTG